MKGIQIRLGNVKDRQSYRIFGYDTEITAPIVDRSFPDPLSAFRYLRRLERLGHQVIEEEAVVREELRVEARKYYITQQRKQNMDTRKKQRKSLKKATQHFNRRGNPIVTISFLEDDSIQVNYPISTGPDTYLNKVETFSGLMAAVEAVEFIEGFRDIDFRGWRYIIPMKDYGFLVKRGREELEEDKLRRKHRSLFDKNGRRRIIVEYDHKHNNDVIITYIHMRGNRVLEKVYENPDEALRFVKVLLAAGFVIDPTVKRKLERHVVDRRRGIS